MLRAIALLAAAGALASAADLRWMIAAGAIQRFEDAGGPPGVFYSSADNFIMNGMKGAGGFAKDYRAIPVAGFRSYADLKAALESGKLPKETKAVLYDPESWEFTPSEEQHDIARFAKLAAEEAHRRGLLFIATPAVDLTRVLTPKLTSNRYDEFLRLGIPRDASRYADVYEIQAQGSLGNLELYTRFVKEAAAQARTANPKVTVFAGLSTNPSGKRVTPKDLYDAVVATREVVAGYWLNIPSGGAACPKCGEAQPQVAVEMFRMLR
jgi:hypothetical protein